MTESEFALYGEGVNISNQLQWEKVRLLCMYAANGDKMKPVRDIKKIIHLPYLDDREDESKAAYKKRVDELKEFAKKMKEAKQSI